MPHSNLVTKCASCGAPIEMGDRMQVAVKWEYKRANRCDPRMTYLDTVSRSRTVCRECGTRVAEMLHVETPEEV